MRSNLYNIACILTTFCVLILADIANIKLKKCCKAYEPLQKNQSTVDECFNKYCDFDSLSQTNVLVFLKHCEGTVVGNLFSCASSNYDHTDCCIANGVHGKCLEYCSTHDGVPSNYIDYLTCLEYFDIVKNCFRNYLKKHPPIKS